MMFVDVFSLAPVDGGGGSLAVEVDAGLVLLTFARVLCWLYFFAISQGIFVRTRAGGLGAGLIGGRG